MQQTLGNCVAQLVGNANKLCEHYESWSIMRRQDDLAFFIGMGVLLKFGDFKYLFEFG
jgi:hypothetical protein